MPAFKKFGPGDQIDNVLVLEPQYDLASGSGGWRGSPEGSASLSLYGGFRRNLAADVNPDIRYQTIHPGLGQVGQVVRGTPLTSSINVVWMTDEALSFTQRSSTRWGEEHWDTVQRLYQDYRSLDPDYTTGSYDNYCLYFQRDSNNIVLFDPPAIAGLNLTASFTVEAWIKPFQTSSLKSDFTIASMNRVFWFGITGSTGRLQVSSSYGTFTSSISPSINRWSHVSLAYDAGTQVGALTINMADVGTFSQSTFSASLGSYLPGFSVGNVMSGTGATGLEGVSSGSKGLPSRSFQGFIGETRLWYVRRSVSQLSSSMSSPLTASIRATTGSIVRTRFNEGPLALYPTDPAANAPTAMGSGTVDLAALEYDVATGTSTRKVWGRLLAFNDRSGPVWHPNDNVSYVTPKVLVGPPVTHPRLISALGLTTSGLTGSGYDLVHRMLVVDVPSAFYGRSIVPNSVVMTCRAYDTGSYGFVRTLIDDGRGGLFLSGSACSSSLSNREDYRGVEWTKVGNVFYGEGLIVIRDPAILDFGNSLDAASLSSHPNDVIQLSFRGQSRIPVKTLMCRIDRGEFNCSANPSFSYDDDDGLPVRRHPSGSLRVSTVGIYNSDRELVGVARLADPPRIRDRDRMNIKLRMDF